jgi:hypothetical protein
MGARVYVLSKNEYSNILGIFTTIRQCRKFVEKMESAGVILVHEIRLNETEKGRKDVTASFLKEMKNVAELRVKMEEFKNRKMQEIN